MPQTQGGRLCSGITAQGSRCGSNEIEGLEYCIQHVPDEYLDEAEDVTGQRRCRLRFGSPEACRAIAVDGSDPARCMNHGQQPGSLHRGYTTIRVTEISMAERLAQILADGGQRLLDPDPVTDPLSELMALAAEVKSLKELLREYVAHLFADGKIRYAHNKAGEQLRMEILLYERALERFAKILIDISKLKIEDRLAGVREKTAAMLEQALDAALEKSGVGLEGKQTAREEFRRHLKIVA